MYLAGNHDWLTDSFVYAEAKKAFDILHGSHHNKLYFITEPMQCVIEWQEVLFLPYMLSPDSLRTIEQSDARSCAAGWSACFDAVFS
jgi:hypothetical protein